MSWVKAFFTSGIGRKMLMGFTGLFLCTFLVVHMSGNFLLLKNDNGAAFNEYAHFMGTNPVIKVASIITFASILLHVIDGFWLAMRNRRSRKVGYHYSAASKSSSWASRSMALLGIIIFFFLIIHLKSFWFEMKFGFLPLEQSTGYKDLYKVVTAAFSQWWYVGLYLISLFALSFHLWHGIQSGFRSLGLVHDKYMPLIKWLGMAFAILIPLGFACQPIWLYIQSLS